MLPTERGCRYGAPNVLGWQQMIYEALSFAVAIGGFAVIFVMLLRSAHLPPLARYAIIGSAFGLFISSRYVAAEHSIHAAIFTIGVVGILATVAVRHFQAFPPEA